MWSADCGRRHQKATSDSVVPMRNLRVYCVNFNSADRHNLGNTGAGIPSPAIDAFAAMYSSMCPFSDLQ